MNNINVRLKIIKNILKEAQMMSTMKTAPKPPVNTVTPPAAPPVNTVSKPKSNVIEPPKQETTQPQNAVPTTPAAQNNAPQEQEEPKEQEQEKESYVVYNITKKAITDKKDKVLNAYYYYNNLNNDDAEYIKNKTFATINVDGIMKASKIKDKKCLTDKKIIALYEPVKANIRDFTIDIFDNNLNKIATLCKKIEKLNIETNIYKYTDKYEIRCHSKEDLDTNTMLLYLEGITYETNVNLNNLKIGKLKRVSFSLDLNKSEGTLIRIG